MLLGNTGLSAPVLANVLLDDVDKAIAELDERTIAAVETALRAGGHNVVRR